MKGCADVLFVVQIRFGLICVSFSLIFAVLLR